MLYQKIRPKSLDGVLGNGPLKQSVKRILASDDPPRCFLLHGPSGCGKTTVARIMATEFGCDRFNLLEKNAASERGIDMSRDLERYAVAAPIGGGCRAVILDEAHQLTKDAQGALLKVLEDIPKHCIYFLCTTDPHKLLPTIRTRSTELIVRPLEDEDMVELLLSASESSIPEPNENVLDEIVKQAEGSPRRALVMLEKVSGLDEDDAIAECRTYRGGNKEMIDLCRAVVNGTWKTVATAYNGLVKDKAVNSDPETIRRAILGYLRSCLLKQGKPHFADAMDALWDNTYDTGDAGIVLMLYRANKAVKGN